MKREPNPIKETVNRFLSKESQRWIRQRKFEEKHGVNPNQHKQKPRPKKPKESSFVRFMNSLQDKGPKKPGTIHEKWTLAIREKMTRDGVWPIEMQDWDLEILAQYLHELQKQFWKSMPKCTHPEHCRDLDTWFYNSKNQAEKDKYYDEVVYKIRTFKGIYVRIRQKGLREKRLIIMRWVYYRTPVIIYLGEYEENFYERRRLWFDGLYEDMRKHHLIIIPSEIIRRRER